jgi:transcriptional regulator with XRE-family HTH domain
MNTNTNRKNKDNSFQDLFKFNGDEAEYNHDSYMLMSGFLSEIELIQKQQGISRKELADKIGTSASYLTQVFRNNKPLNFYTLAKIKRALNIRFSIKAIPLNGCFTHSDDTKYVAVSNYEIDELIKSENLWVKDMNGLESSATPLKIEKLMTT